MTAALPPVGGTAKSRSRQMDPAARLRVLLLLAFLIVGTIFGVIRLALDMELSGRIDYTWIVVLVVIDGVIASFVILQIRSREIQFGEVQVRLDSRAKEEGSAGAGWTLASFDNGLVMQGQRQGPIVSFYLCYDASRQRYAPTMAEIQEYTRGFGVMRPVQTISATKGDPSARALLEQLRNQIGAKRARMVFQKRRPEKRPTVRAPSWIVGVTLFWPKWSMNADAILNGLDPIEALLDSAQRQYFAPAMAAG